MGLLNGADTKQARTEHVGECGHTHRHTLCEAHPSENRIYRGEPRLIRQRVWNVDPVAYQRQITGNLERLAEVRDRAGNTSS